MVSIIGGMGRFVPMVMVVERENVTGAWYWKGLPTRTLVFERQMCAPRHKLSKECLMVMCCGTASRNYNQTCSDWKRQNHDWSRVLKQTAFLSIITTRKEHG
jgi:hypothetical protein